jgi:hypothetical protein
LLVGDYVLVKFQLKNSTRCYVGLVQDIAEGEATISFMRKKSERFVVPEAEDTTAIT